MSEDYLQDRKSGKGLVLFYYNPMVLKVLDTLMNHKGALLAQSDDQPGTLVCWYPVESP